MSRTELEILEQLRETSLLPSQIELLDELEEVLKVSSLWPLLVREAAEEALGGGIHNPKGRDHKSIDRRVRHAMKVWRARYGGMNPGHQSGGDRFHVPLDPRDLPGKEDLRPRPHMQRIRR